MVEPGIFGPYFWYSIHYMCLGAPKQLSSEDKKNYRLYFNNLQHWIPCDICSVHYNENIKKINLNKYMNENKLFEFSIDLHNLINKMLGKREWTYEEGYNYYKNSNKNKNSCINYRLVFEILSLIIIIVLGLLLYNKKK
jgi:hypothetical protein